MFRPFSTALVVAVFSSALCGAAQATTTSAPAAVTSAALERAAAEASSPAASEAVVPDGSTSTALTANADLTMWSAPAGHAVARTDADAKRTDTIHRFARGIVSRTSSIAMNLTRSAMRFIGTPYVFGGTSPSGFDCSGYVQHVFAMLGIAVPRTADAQYYAGRPTVGGMVAGDLVFFQTYEPGPSHVGIYIGGGRFIHSSSHGVMISGLRDGYWSSRYLGAKRVVALR